MICNSVYFVFLVGATNATARLLHPGPGSVDFDSGESIGHAIADTVDGMYAGKPVEAVGRLQKLAGQIQDGLEVIVNPAVTTIVANANRVMRDAGTDDIVCKRKYSFSCPDGWFSFGARCVASSSYKGGCERIFNSIGTDAAAKARFARACSAPWPCDDDCVSGHDYDSSLCPTGWMLQQGLCRKQDVHVDKLHECSSSFYLTALDVATKQELTKTCGLKWPCQNTKCERDYSNVCPSDWQLEHELCIAPVQYVGSCSRGIDMRGWTVQQKTTFSEDCLVQYPCLQISRSSMNTVATDKPHGDPVAYFSDRFSAE